MQRSARARPDMVAQSYGNSILPWGLDDSPPVSTLFSPERECLTLSVSEAKAIFELMRCRWDSSNAQSPLLRALSHHDKKACPILKAVIFGLGPIAGDALDCTSCERLGWEARFQSSKDKPLKSMLQLIVFMRAVEYISDGQINMYAQDPAFTSEDQDFLQSLGVQVLCEPEGESIVDQTTMVYAHYIPIPHMIHCLTRCPRHQPWLYIGHNIDLAIKCLSTYGMWDDLDPDTKGMMLGRLLTFKDRTIAMNMHNSQSELERSAH